jgi:1,2-diacylglycerol 3-alpha-glucosyltransferase
MQTGLDAVELPTGNAQRGTQPSVGAKEPHVAVMFSRIGPYHFSRLKAAAARLRVTALEFSDIDSTYAWDLLEGQDGFDRLVLFPGMPLESRSASHILEVVDKTLDALRPAAVAVSGWSDRCSLATLKWCVRHAVPAIMMSETNAWDDKRKIWRELAKKWVLRLCSVGLVGGKGHADYLVQLGMARDRIYLGYDVVDNEYFGAKATEIGQRKAEMRKQFGLPAKYFLASARFVEKKNLARLIQAYARYRQLASQAASGKRKADIWNLVLLGDGPLRSIYNSQLTSLNLCDHVLLPGFKQYRELPVYYGLASTFVHSSTVEQWGLVVNEAMASGLPVLVSDRCGCATDLVKSGVNGFTFDPYNVEQLSELMLDLSSPGIDLAGMGRASQEIISEWGPKRFADGLAQAVNVAVTSPGPDANALDAWFLRSLLKTRVWYGRIKTERRAAVTVLPNFFIIGAPKSGTTSLSEYLRVHPNIYFSRVKEPHFFDRDTSKRLKLSLRTYLSLFAKADPGLHKAVGEGSTGYLFSNVAVSEILRFNPDSRFIVMLRNPVELVRAWHSQMYFEGVENIREFEMAWRLEGTRRHGYEIPHNCWEPKKLFYSEWGKLGDQMERLFSVVDRDRVMVILFDDFVADPKRVYEEVLAFLGVQSDGRTDFPQINENRSLTHPKLQQALAFLANCFRLTRAVSGLNLALGLGVFQKLLFLNSHQAPRESISLSLRAELDDLYREEVQKLSKLLDRDLSYWVPKSPHPCGSFRPRK